MEQAKSRLKADLKLLEKGLHTLSSALNEPFTDIVRDAVIQRFEYVFELAWKTMQVAAQFQGMTCNIPREAIKSAFKLGWIKNAEHWFEAMEARNKTSHTYNEELAGEVYKIAKKFPHSIQELLLSLKKN